MYIPAPVTTVAMVSAIVVRAARLLRDRRPVLAAVGSASGVAGRAMGETWRLGAAGVADSGAAAAAGGSAMGGALRLGEAGVVAGGCAAIALARAATSGSITHLKPVCRIAI